MAKRILIGIGIVLAGAGYLRFAAGQQQTSGSAERSAAVKAESPNPANVSDRRLFVNRYCIACHNEKLRTADLLLDKSNIDNVSEDAEIWEKVSRKLRARAMPPVGMPRPDKDGYDSFIRYLETELDRAAETHPNPGRPADHRLNRAEYANAIRDLLDLEIDGEALLPQDNAGYGFDNNGDVLAVSPLLMERYMLAAGKISKLAVGGGSTRPAGETYTVLKNLVQNSRVSEDLPFGSRGGIAIRHRFPADGEYVINVTLQKNMDGYIRGIIKPNLLDVRVDDARIKLFTIGGERKGRSGPAFTANQNPEYRGDLEQVGYEFTADEGLQVRFPARAGTHVVGVAFLKQPSKPEGVLMPAMLLGDFDHYKGGEAAVESVTVTGPYDPKGPGDTSSRRKIFVCTPKGSGEEESCARKIVSGLSRLAYRRPVTDAEVQDLMDLYRAGRGEGSFEAGIEMALQGILAGPEFLFRTESDPPKIAPGTAYRIGDLELASRLSFFLWSSIPDEELLDFAQRGELKDPAVLERQVRRMLADSRSRAMVDNFAGQWLYLRNMRQVSPDPNKFPDFDDELRQAFQKETELFFESMLRQDRPVVNLLNADYTFVNERLARHYGIPNILGSRFRQVPVTEEARKGLLGQGSILTVTSYGGRTSPVLRGKWVLENLLSMPPPPPPPDVPALEEKSKDGKVLTMRQAMEQHRANPACSVCHKMMDPIGFSMENFDAVGRYRTSYTEANAPIDASGVLFDGANFQGVVEFRKVLLSHSDEFIRTVTEKLLTYAVGRGVQYYDAPAVRKILREAAPANYTWSSLILGIVKSAPFQMRRSHSS